MEDGKEGEGHGWWGRGVGWGGGGGRWWRWVVDKAVDEWAVGSGFGLWVLAMRMRFSAGGC